MNRFVKGIKKGFMWYLHHGLRVIWANLFGFLVHIKYLFVLRSNKQAYARYKGNQEKWNITASVDDLRAFFKDVYRYKWDGPKGLFDHNNYDIEFFADFGDCDDVGHYVCQKLRQIYGKKLEYCKTRGYADLSAKPAFWHYDCVYKFKDENEYHLFNYGYVQSSRTIAGLDDAMTDLYGSSYEFKGLVSWPCFWM